MKTATVKMFKERPNGDLSEFIIELTIPSRRRYGAVIREYIEYYNAKNFAKIYFYEVLELETSKSQRGAQMNEEETVELLKFLMTDYGRGYLKGLVCGLSMILEILKKAE